MWDKALLGAFVAKSKSAPGPFLKGPIRLEWLTAAARLRGKALVIGLAAHYAAGVRGTHGDISVSNELAEVWGINRYAKQRALERLAAAGLITMTQEGKAAPRGTIVSNVAGPRDEWTPVRNNSPPRISDGARECCRVQTLRSSGSLAMRPLAAMRGISQKLAQRGAHLLGAHAVVVACGCGRRALWRRAGGGGGGGKLASTDAGRSPCHGSTKRGSQPERHRGISPRTVHAW